MNKRTKKKKSLGAPERKWIYRGFAPIDDQLVFVTAAHSTVNRDSDGLEHRVLHSPDGFAWGYHGNAAKDLSRSILWHHLGYEPSELLCSKFRVDFVSTWDARSNWDLVSMEVDEWLAQNKDIPRCGS